MEEAKWEQRRKKVGYPDTGVLKAATRFFTQRGLRREEIHLDASIDHLLLTSVDRLYELYGQQRLEDDYWIFNATHLPEEEFKQLTAYFMGLFDLLCWLEKWLAVKFDTTSDYVEEGHAQHLPDWKELRGVFTLRDLAARIAWIWQDRPAPAPYLRYQEVAGVPENRRCLWRMWGLASVGSLVTLAVWLRPWQAVVALFPVWVFLFVWSGEALGSRTRLLTLPHPYLAEFLGVSIRVKPVALAARLYRDYWRDIWSRPWCPVRGPVRIDAKVFRNIQNEFIEYAKAANQVKCKAQFRTWLMGKGHGVDEQLKEIGYKRSPIPSNDESLKGQILSVSIVYLLICQLPITFTRAWFQTRRGARGSLLWRVVGLPRAFLMEVTVPAYRPWWNPLITTPS